ncbi:hypothetical protein V2G26_005526 [Clonostachys chloroleuca]|uniref:F-box domain-containing protein n=1 Tax=Clonostachys chloroleuca TaxID=1926264 RepID=A0AA35LW80_9HYPO|nr:unnamed protein product [Clonostachys chloroleuca]
MNVDLLPDICLEITGWLAPSDVARLTQCSKAWHRKWEPLLLFTLASRQKLMFYGCSRGQGWAVDKAMSYGHFPCYEDLETAIQYILRYDAAPFAEYLLSREPFRQLLAVFDPLQGPKFKRMLQYRYSTRVPMFAAAMRMAESGETGIVDMLLTTRLDINQPLIVALESLEESVEGRCMVSPVWAYVLADFPMRKHKGPFSASEGLQYLFHHGAVIQTTTQAPSTSERPAHSLLELFWTRNNGFRSLLNDDLYAMTRILIRKQAARGAVPAFLLWRDNILGLNPGPLFQRMVPHTRLKPSLEQKQSIIRRWSAILDILLTPRNFELPFQEELNHLLFLFLMRVVKKLAGQDFREAFKNGPDMSYMSTPLDIFIPAPGLDDELDPITIRKLIEKGADIRWRPTWGEYRGQSILEAIAVNQTQGQGQDSLMAIVRPSRQQSFVSTLLGLGAERVDTGTPNLRGRLGMRGHPRAWFRFVQRTVQEDRALLWCPTAAFLLGYRPPARRSDEAEEGVAAG